MTYTRIAGTVIAALLLSTANATVWHVTQGSTLNSIQSGLNICSTGDTVMVASGTYYENIIWPNVQGIVLVSEKGPRKTTINGNGAGSVITITTGVDTTTTIKGFTITNGTGTLNPWGYPSGGGIYCAYSSPTITENIIRSNVTTNLGDGGGIYCFISSPIIAGNTILDNHSDGWGGGICCYYNCNPRIEENVVRDNFSVWQGGGLACLAYSSPVITGNTISENVAYPACVGGIYICYYCSATIEENNIEENVAEVNGGGIAVLENSFATINNNTIIENVAKYGYGGGIGIGTYSSVMVSGNTIIENSALTRGGGIVVGEGAVVDISGNTISENKVHERGGGIAIGYGCTVTMDNNTISENEADERGGGIVVAYYSTLTIRSSTIAENKGSYGGGIGVWDNCWVSIDSCSITENKGDGIYCENNCLLTTDHNDISENKDYGIRNHDMTSAVNAINNWWGDASGPSGVGPGMGDEVSDYVDFNPWLTAPLIFGHGGEIAEGIQGDDNSFDEPYILLYQNLPNPFKHITHIEYELAYPGHVTLSIYNLVGQKIITLVDAQKLPGIHCVTWDGSDKKGHSLPNGVYFCTMTAGDYTDSRKMMILR